MSDNHITVCCQAASYNYVSDNACILLTVRTAQDPAVDGLVSQLFLKVYFLKVTVVMAAGEAL